MFYKIRANYKSYNMRYFVFLFILSLTNAITLYKSQFSTHMNSAQNNRFVLTLEYGSLDQYDIQSASAQIFWNSDKLGTITSSSREKEIFSSLVKVVEGKNKLTIKGSDKSLGIIIDNVLLTRQGASDSIVENGNFQTKFPVGQTSINSFVGWIGSPQVANGKKLNKKWPDSTVALVGRDIKSSLVQIFKFDRDYRLLTPKYFLSFQYAAQSQSPLSSAIATITWNDQVFNIEPKDYEVHKFQKEVLVLKNKNNLLKINGEGRADGYGLTIDNVKLIGLGSSLNLVLNGDFQIPHLKDRVQNLNILPGWQSNNKKITVGIGSQFNKKWSKTTGQILTLDNKQNLYIEQRFNFGADYKYIHKEKPYFTVSFNYAAPDEVDLSSSKGELLFDGQVIAQLSPQDKKVHLFEQKISMKPGNNEFIIRPLNKNTILIGNFRIVREGQTEDVAANGNFLQSAYKGLIVGWTGQGQVLDSQQANKLWRDAKVAKITSSKGISQSVELNKDFRIKTNKFVLQFQFVPTSQAPLNVPLGEVSWNGQVFKIIATHYKINIFKVVVIASRGRNLLTLQGQGIQGEGVTIDNVKFTPYGSSALAVNNGDFQDPEIKGIKNYQQFYVITDWQGHNIELGQGEKYSEFWLEKNGQVLSLATAQKTVISKVLSLSEQLSIFDKEPRQFKLSFKYAAEEGKPLAKTGGEIFWNKVLVGDIVPTNYEINSYTIILRARHGINNLFIKGAGGIEAYGLTLDDVELYRQGSKDNLIQNGKFDKAGTPGWASIINNAPLLNHHWYKNKVGKIDAVQNLTLSKTFQFDSQYIYKTNKFILKFDYALHKDGRVGKAKATCYWNNNKFNLQPRHSKVQKFESVVFANHGENVLKFQGEGITIDDVRLVPWGSAVSVLLNGGFEDPQFINTEFNGIPSGWKTDSILFSKGYHASIQWPYSASQVITLTKRNNFISQIVTLAKDNRAIRSQFSFHELQLDFAGIEEEDLEDCKGIVYWNNREIATLAPTGRGTSKLIVKLDVVAGENSLTLKGLESGILVSNVDLVRYTLSENIIENGKFNQIYYGKDIPYWQGSATIADSQEYNKKWEGAKVAYLKAANSITQKFTFDGNLRLITKKLVLNFEYTVRQGVKFQTAKAKAIWNDQVFDLAPQDYGLHLFNRIVQARPGNNYIIFQSNGVKRLFGTFAEGFTLDNVWVRSYGSSKNLLVNGGFQQPKIEGFDYGMFTNRLPGWITKDIYLGVGYYFSKNWVDTQIVELDGNHEDAKLMQRIKIGPNWQIIQ